MKCFFLCLSIIISSTFFVLTDNDKQEFKINPRTTNILNEFNHDLCVLKKTFNKIVLEDQRCRLVFQE